MHQEYYNGNFVISTDPARLDIEKISGFLARSYWANNRPREVIARSLENSLCFGVYSGAEQVGFARVVTDYATFAYRADVFIDEAFRKEGLGKWLIPTILNYPDLQGLRRWLLVTRDAQGLYQKSGFTELKNAERWLE